jgi:hypothetical protein
MQIGCRSTQTELPCQYLKDTPQLRRFLAKLPSREETVLSPHQPSAVTRLIQQEEARRIAGRSPTCQHQ